MGASVSLDKEAFRALAGEKRVLILKELAERRKTQSELATKMRLSAPTVNEHLLLLKKAGLVEEIDDGHKWKYFALTQKGKSIMNPEETRIMLVLSIFAMAFVGMLVVVAMQYAGFSAVKEAAPQPMLQTTELNTTGAANATAIDAAAQAGPFQLPALEIASLVLLALVIGVLAGYLIRQQKN